MTVLWKQGQIIKAEYRMVEGVEELICNGQMSPGRLDTYNPRQTMAKDMRHKMAACDKHFPKPFRQTFTRVLEVNAAPAGPLASVWCEPTVCFPASWPRVFCGATVTLHLASTSTATAR